MKSICRPRFIGCKVVFLTLLMIAVSSLSPAMAQSTTHMSASTGEAGRHIPLAENVCVSSYRMPTVDLAATQPVGVVGKTHLFDHVSDSSNTQQICCQWYYWCDYYFCYYQEYCWYCYYW